MSHDRVARIPLVWPTTLVRPTRAKVVYLDLNHFINLAKYAHGHHAFRHYAGLMSAVLRAQADGRTVFPLSTVHYVEMAGIPDLGRRGDGAEVMETVTDAARNAALDPVEFDRRFARPSAISTAQLSAAFWLPNTAPSL
ncbi:hypothetical protein [Nocardioides sp. cx-173]|uniref:hypothetical protein n=1 Tax=Nocardioides sp. cx-173 TaxID=2898796 RepID=UPI001E5B8F61|nr:hypothetical protein [Nocardioides sp. cx-173]MCD4524713.1 hypothetical protein [Nocardioides sp. cx-173]UGB43223.1 hypothetical protein LQ940_06755 [Nocardioides sp. cx-173]